VAVAVAVAVAMPAALVVVTLVKLAPAPLPGPAKVTVTPETGFPLASATRAATGMLKAVPARASWPLPAYGYTTAAAPTAGAAAKVAVTLWLPLIATVQVRALPVQAPLHEVKLAPAIGMAVRTTDEPSAKLPVVLEQPEPHEIALGDEVSVPFAAPPDLVRDSVREVPIGMVSTAVLLVGFGSVVVVCAPAVTVCVIEPRPEPATMVPFTRYVSSPPTPTFGRTEMFPLPDEVPHFVLLGLPTLFEHDQVTPVSCAGMMSVTVKPPVEIAVGPALATLKVYWMVCPQFVTVLLADWVTDTSASGVADPGMVVVTLAPRRVAALTAPIE